jgi:hypothetical protein
MKVRQLLARGPCGAALNAVAKPLYGKHVLGHATNTTKRDRQARDHTLLTWPDACRLKGRRYVVVPPPGVSSSFQARQPSSMRPDA